MLVKRCEKSFKQLIESIENKLQLSDELLEKLQSDRGATRSTPFELRANSRFRCYGDGVVTIAPESFRMPGQDSQSIAIVRDLSRKGIGILSHQQWYPDQLVILDLENALISARVARARRLGPQLFRSGIDHRPAPVGSRRLCNLSRTVVSTVPILRISLLYMDADFGSLDLLALPAPQSSSNFCHPRRDLR